MKLLIGAAVLALLVGCSSNAITVQQAEQASADKVFAFQTKPSVEFGKLTVVRDGGFNSSACDFVVYLDGKKAAKLGSGQKASFFVPTGSLNVSAGLEGSGLCSGQAMRTVAAKSEAGKENIYRISSDMSGIHLGPYVEY
ncbi:hypothetical protein [Pseudomonas viridiflava]|uniref:hypothetical protein n=1 Tax=Pseudomonas viridiflava TaxID=33069 RepID=UPI000F053AC1|nr:hypothetical protein [Pseudomonas viridiflava]